MRDTTPAAEQAYLAAIRAMQPAVRLRQALDLSETGRQLLMAGLRTRYPDRTDLQLVELSLGRRLMPVGSEPSTR